MKNPTLSCAAAIAAMWIAAGIAAAAPQVSPLRLLVLNKAEATASIFDVESRHEIALVPVGDGPHEVAVAPDGRTAVVANYGGQRAGSTLTVIDVAAGAALRTIELLQPGRSASGQAADEEKRFLRPHGVQFLPDGGRVVVTSETQRRLLVVDLDARAVVRALPTVQPLLHMVALADDGRTAFGTSMRDGTLGVFDLGNGRDDAARGTATGDDAARETATGDGAARGTAAGDEAARANAGAGAARVIATGAGAEGLAVRPGTSEVWVANREADTVSIYDAQRGEVVAELPTGESPIRVACTPDGARAFVTCAEAGLVQVFDCARRELVSAIDLLGDKTELSPLPIGIRIQPDGARAWVACARGEFLAVIDLATLQVIDRVPARRGPDGMAFARVLPPAQERQDGVAGRDEEFLVKLQNAVPEQTLDVADAQHVEFSPDGSTLLVATADAVALHDLDRRRETRWSADGPLRHAAFGSGGSVVVAGDETVRRLDAELRRIVGAERRVVEMYSPVHAAAPAADLTVTLETSCIVPGNGWLRIWRGDSPPVEVAIHDRWGVRQGALRADSNMLALVTGGGRVQLHGLPGGERIANLDHWFAEPDENGTRGGFSPTCIAFAGADRLVIGDSRGFVRTWSLPARRDTARWRTSGPVAGLCIAAGGRVIATTDDDGRVQVFRLATARPSDRPDPGAADRWIAVPFDAPAPGRLVCSDSGRRFAWVAADAIRVFK